MDVLRLRLLRRHLSRSSARSSSSSTARRPTRTTSSTSDWSTSSAAWASSSSRWPAPCTGRRSATSPDRAADGRLLRLAWPSGIRANIHTAGGSVPSPHCAVATVMWFMALQVHPARVSPASRPVILSLYVSTVYGRFHYLSDMVIGIAAAGIVIDPDRVRPIEKAWDRNTVRPGPGARPVSRVFVTGANGFVGSNLCRWFRERGWEVDALVRESSDLHFLRGPRRPARSRATSGIAERIDMPAGTTPRRPRRRPRLRHGRRRGLRPEHRRRDAELRPQALGRRAPPAALRLHLDGR
ncbi:MAG: phosphatase PAP2 family protein [Candidatus Moduliflexus flocculans]|nr:phosphatase PAP2 family protein [Candidatus Moduliflexus flocculans]